MQKANKIFTNICKNRKRFVTRCVLLCFLVGCEEKYAKNLEKFKKYIKTSESRQLAPSQVAAHVDPFCSVRGVKYLVQNLEERDGIDAEVATVTLAVIYESLPAIQMNRSAKAEILNLIENSIFFENARYFAEKSTLAWVRNNLVLFLRRVRSESGV